MFSLIGKINLQLIDGISAMFLQAFKEAETPDTEGNKLNAVDDVSLCDIQYIYMNVTNRCTGYF